MVEGGVWPQEEQVQAGELAYHPFSKAAKLMLASIISLGDSAAVEPEPDGSDALRLLPDINWC